MHLLGAQVSGIKILRIFPNILKVWNLTCVRRLGPFLPIVCHTTWTTWPPVRLRLASQPCAAASQRFGLLAAARRRSMLMIYTTGDQTFPVLVSRTSFRTALRISALF